MPILCTARYGAVNSLFRDDHRAISPSSALRAREPVVIRDVEGDAPFAPFRAVARAAGYRAVVSIPMTAGDGSPLGMVSTHFRRVHAPTLEAVRRLDLYARLVAGFIERCRNEQTQREIAEQQAQENDALSGERDGLPFISENGEKWHEVCARAAVEKNPAKLTELVKELAWQCDRHNARSDAEG